MTTFARLTAFVLAAGCSLTGGAFEQDGPPRHLQGPRMEMPGPKLTEAQEDKLFAIMHAQEPQRREHERAAQKAREGLREMSESGKFDEAKAAALAQAEGKAVAALSLLRARNDAQVAALLTPEQREEFKQRRPGRGPRP